jgi:hypothetical protein
MDFVPAAPPPDAPSVGDSSSNSVPHSTAPSGSPKASGSSGGIGGGSFLEELKKKELKKVVPVKQEPKVETSGGGLSGLLAQAMAGRRAQFGMSTAPGVNGPAKQAAAPVKKQQEALWD